MLQVSDDITSADRCDTPTEVTRDVCEAEVRLTSHDCARLVSGQQFRRSWNEAASVRGRTPVMAQGPWPTRANLAVVLLSSMVLTEKPGSACIVCDREMLRFAVTPGLSTSKYRPPSDTGASGYVVALMKSIIPATNKPAAQW